MDYKSYSFFLRASSMVCVLVFLCGLGLVYKLENERTLLSSGGTQRATAAETAPWWCEVRALFSWPCEDISVMDRESSKFSFGDQTAAVFNSANSLWCDFRDWLSWPCEDSTVDTVTPAPPRAPTPPVTSATTTNAFSKSPVHVNKTEPTYVTNEYVTRPLEREILREVVIKDNNIDTSHFITRSDYDAQVNALLTSVEGSSSGASNALSELSDSLATSFTTDALTVSGSGSLSILSVGTTSAYDVFTLDGMAYLSPVSAPTTTTNRLYNYNDNLYWSGNPVVGTLVGSWTSDGTHAWRPTGNVGIGSSTPSSKLTVQGDTWIGGNVTATGTLAITGATALSSTLNVTGNTTLANASTTNLTVSGNSYLGTVRSGTWNGSTIGETYGGTGQTTYATGDILYASGSNTLAKRTIGSTGDILMVSGGVPTWTATSSLGLGASFFQQNGNSFGTTATLGTNDSNNLAFETNNSTRMTVTSTGNVGIGTTNPDGTLHVHTATAGTVTASGDANDFVVENSTNGGISVLTPDEYVGGLWFGSPSDSVGGGMQWTYGAAGAYKRLLIGSVTTGGVVSLVSGNGVEAVRIDSAGNVGIGTTSPGSRLELGSGQIALPLGSVSAPSYSFSGDLNTGIYSNSSDILSIAAGGVTTGYFTSSQARFRAGSAGAPGISFINDANTGVFGNDADQLSLATAGLERVTITSAGNVGIGTTSPSEKLEVSGNIKLTGSNGVLTSGLNDWYLSGAHLDARYGVWVGATSVADRDYGITSDTSSKLSLYSAGSEAVTILNSGNVGIGTTSPAALLHLYDNLSDTPSIVLDSGQGAGNGGAMIWRRHNVTKVNQYLDSSNNWRMQVGGSDRVTVNTSGNVGIGTTSPSERLEISGESHPAIKLTSTNDGNWYTALENNYSVAECTVLKGRGGDKILNYACGSGAQSLGLYTAGSEKLTIGATGNVGIGTSSPSHLFTVAGDTNQTGALRFNGNAGTTGQILLSNGSSAPTWTATSSLGLGASFFQQDGNSFGTTATLGTNDANNLAFETNNTVRMTIASTTGNVGIGTTTPSAKLTVGAGNVLVERGYAFQSLDTGGVPRNLALIGADNSVVYAPATLSGDAYYGLNSVSNTTGRLFLQTAGLNRMMISQSGNVGIGTTTPGAKLTVQGSGTGNVVAGGWGGDSSYGALSVNGSLATGDANFYSPSSGTQNLFINRPTNGYIDFRMNNSSQMLLTSSGNVGIGTTTPSNLLDVVKDQAASTIVAVNNSNAAGRAIVNAVGESGNNTTIQSVGSTNSAVTDWRSSGVLTTSWNTLTISAYQPSGVIRFQTGGAVSGAERMRITSSGNVGIGTTSPLGKLHIAESDTSTNAFNNGSALVLQNTSSTANNWSELQFSAADGIIAGGIGAQITNQSSRYGDLGFFTRGSAGWGERVRITSTGNVGIGTTSPGAKLEVASGQVLVPNGLVTAPGLAFSGNADTGIFSNGDNVRFSIGGTVRFVTDNSAMTLYQGIVTDSSGGISIGGFKQYAPGGSPMYIRDQTNGRMQVTYTPGATADTAITNISSKLTVDSNLVVSGTGNTTIAGNVGIGTSSPVSTLSVQSSNADILDLARSGVGNYRLTISSNDRFGIYDVGAASERLVIDTSGNVGIGTTSPGAKLTVVGSIAARETDDGNNVFLIEAGVGSASLRLYEGGTAKILLDPTSGDSYINNGNVGIGTTSPQTKLSVYNGASTVAAAFQGGGNGAVGIGSSSGGPFLQGYTNDTLAGTAQLVLQPSGANTIINPTSGNVGIGTTTPSAKLTVGAGNVLVERGYAFQSLDTGGVPRNLAMIDAGNHFQYVNAAGSGSVYLGLNNAANTSGDVFIQTAGQNRVTVLDSGYVGIGTTAPSSKLSVYGGATIGAGYEGTAAPTDGLIIKGNVGIGTTNPGTFKLQVAGNVGPDADNTYSLGADGVGSRWANIYSVAFRGDTFGPRTGATSAFYTNSSTRGVQEGTSGLSEGLALGTSITQLVSQGLPRLTITNGNVGIGTASPGYKLEVQTNTDVYGIMTGDSANSNLRISGTASGATGYGLIQTFTGGTNAGGSLVFQRDAGNVGIGTTNPSTFKLQVAGNVGPNADDTYNLGAAGNDWGCLYYNSGTLGTCASDERLKEQITTLSFADETEGALEKLTRLELRSYAFKSAPGSLYHGLIAQEVREAGLDALVMQNNNGFLAVKYGDLQWLIIEAVQELSRTIGEFSDKISALFANDERHDAELEALRERVLELEAREGIEAENNNDSSGAIDLCPNIDGTQAGIPSGYTLDTDSNECIEDTAGGDETPVTPAVPPEPASVPGCMDEEATNHNPDATEDDDSCDYPEPEPVTPEIVDPEV